MCIENLFAAAAIGDLSCIKRLYKPADHLHAINHFGNNLLQHTVLYAPGHAIIEICSWLIETGMGNSAKGAVKARWLCAAALGDQEALAAVLRLADPYAVNSSGENALHLAVRSDNLACLSWLLALGIDGNTEYDKHLYIEKRNNSGDTPLLLATSMGCFEMTRSLYRAGADVRSLNYLGESALHLACRSSQSIFLVQWLMTHVPLEAKIFRSLKTAFLFVMSSERVSVEILHVLREGGVNLNVRSRGGKNAIYCMLENYSIEISLQKRILFWLLECGVDVNHNGDHGYTLFLYAAKKHWIDILDYLVGKKLCDPKRKRYHGVLFELLSKKNLYNTVIAPVVAYLFYEHDLREVQCADREDRLYRVLSCYRDLQRYRAVYLLNVLRIFFRAYQEKNLALLTLPGEIWETISRYLVNSALFRYDYSGKKRDLVLQVVLYAHSPPQPGSTRCDFFRKIYLLGPNDTRQQDRDFFMVAKRRCLAK